jgi:hypothetical protein
MGRRSNTVVEHLPHHPKVKGSIPVQPPTPENEKCYLSYIKCQGFEYSQAVGTIKNR